MLRSIFPDCDAISRITIGIQSLQNLQDIGLKGAIAIGDICRCDNVAGGYWRECQIADKESHCFTRPVVVLAKLVGETVLGCGSIADSGNRAVYEDTGLHGGIVAIVRVGVVLLAAPATTTAGSNCQRSSQNEGAFAKW